MAQDIIKDLEPTNEGLQELNRNLQFNEVKRTPPQISGKRKRESKYGPLAARFYRNYLNLNGQMDKTLGIRYEDGKPMIGDKLIDIVGDNIVIDNKVYTGLWNLNTDKTPKECNEKDNEKDNEWYMHRSNYPRDSKSQKWNVILCPIWDKFQEGYDSKYQSAKGGDGILAVVSIYRKTVAVLMFEIVEYI